MTPFAKWAIALLTLMIVAVPVGVGLLVGDTVGPQAGVGAAILSLGVTSGIGSRWIGDS